jgi:hypothetical protein
MGDARKAGRKELAYGCRRSEGAPQANEPKRSAHLKAVILATGAVLLLAAHGAC